MTRMCVAFLSLQAVTAWSLSSTTVPKARWISSSACLGTSNLWKLEKAEPRCLALTIRNVKFKSSFVLQELYLPTPIARLCIPLYILFVAMNDAWHHSVLYAVANYNGMATKIQVFTELSVCACDNYWSANLVWYNFQACNSYTTCTFNYITSFPGHSQFFNVAPWKTEGPVMQRHSDYVTCRRKTRLQVDSGHRLPA